MFYIRDNDMFLLFDYLLDPITLHYSIHSLVNQYIKCEHLRVLLEPSVGHQEPDIFVSCVSSNAVSPPGKAAGKIHDGHFKGPESREMTGFKVY